MTEETQEMINRLKALSKTKKAWYIYVPLFIGFILFGYLTYLYFVLTPQLANADFNTLLPISSKIVDRNGELLYEVGGDVQREIVKSEEIPDLLKSATIVAEDRDFYAHPGINLKSIARAAIANMKAGETVEGGSTITQQLVKNTLLTPEKKISRKIQEAVLAMMIETRLSKDEILTSYLNSISYGNNIRGVKKAADTYFGKELHELTLNEMVTLAALPQAPSRMSLYNGDEKARDARKDEIFSELLSRKIVSQEQVDEAKNSKLVVKPRSHALAAAHFSLMVRDQLIEHFGREKVEQGGLVIKTTLDSKLQADVEKIVASHRPRLAGYGASNASVVVSDPRTGEILAMVGSFDYYDSKIDGNVNLAISPRQPGSSFKPIVYSALFANTNYSPASIIFDVPTDFNGYRPKNYNGRTNGPLPIRRALAGSLNIPAVKATSIVGVDAVLANAENLGLTTLTEKASNYGLAVGLGAGEVKLTEMVNAFGTFANQGKNSPVNSIISITDPRGEVIYEYKASPQQVLQPEVAYQISNILSDNQARSFVFGPNSPLGFAGNKAAAKTGTSQNWRDGWTLGYTTSRVVGVWTGNNNGKYMRYNADGVVTAAPIWKQVMERAMQGLAYEEFARPETMRLVRGEYLAEWQLSGNIGHLAMQSENPNNPGWERGVQEYLRQREEQERLEQERIAREQQEQQYLEPGMGGAPEEQPFPQEQPPQQQPPQSQPPVTQPTPSPSPTPEQQPVVQ